MASTHRLRVGVIGCGGIAQMMHLPFLFSMSDCFQIAALSDISPGVLRAMGARYQVPESAQFTDYQELLRLDLDAVLVLSGGDHYPQVLGALQAGKHVLCEKPLCFTLKEADALAAAAQEAGRILMVAYMKRFDPGYQYAQQRLREMRGLRYVQVNTLHPSEDDYLAIHNLIRYEDVPPEVLSRLRDSDDQAIVAAVGQVAPNLKSMYAGVFLGSMVHDTNALRGLIGEPEKVLFTDLWPAHETLATVTSVIRYPEDVRVVFTWTYLNDLRNYFEEIALMSPANRLRIQFPSPYLRHFPTPVVFEGMDGSASFEKRVIASYDEAFRRELEAFYHCVVEDQPPLTGVADARRDIQLLQQMFAALHPQGLAGEAALFA